jgi:hypothetical protein
MFLTWCGGGVVLLAAMVARSQLSTATFWDNYEGYVGLERFCRGVGFVVSRDYPNPGSLGAKAASFLTLGMYAVALPAGWIINAKGRAGGWTPLLKSAQSWTMVLGVLWVMMWVIYAGVRLILTKTTFGIFGPIWVSRYLGIIWPVVMMGVCVMLARIPALPIRWMVFGLFIAANLAQGAGRLFADTEARVDLMTADLYQNHPMEARVFVQSGNGSPHPGGGTLEHASAAYYAALRRQAPWPPMERFNSMLVRRDVTVVMDTSPSRIARDASEGITKVIVWDRIPFDAIPEKGDEILEALGKDWELSGKLEFAIRYHWNWSRLYILRRREYINH